MGIGLRRSTLFGGHNMEIYNGKESIKLEEYKRGSKILIF